MVLRILYIFLFFTGISSSQVQVFLQQPPPNQFHIEDMWRLTLLNTTSSSYSVYMIGKATETTLGDVLTATTKPFTLPPGLKTIVSSELGGVDVDYQNEKIKEIIKNAGTIPSGNYTICVTVYSFPDNTQLGIKCTIPQDVVNMTIPVLVAPINKSTVSEEFPVFTWMPPSPVKASQNIAYTLKIVEILPRQTPLDALLSNPPWYEKSNLTGAISVYPVTSRNFTEKTRYAWKIKAYLHGVFINESEVFEFTYTRAVKDDIRPSRRNPIREIKKSNIEKMYGDIGNIGD